MTTSAPPRRRPLYTLIDVPPIREVHPPAWFHRLPQRVTTVTIVVVLMLLAAFLHSRVIGAQLWFNEAIAIGIASHPLGQLFGVLRHGGSSPLYYLVLHFWIQAVGNGESATRWLSLGLGLLAVPLGCWVGWSLGGRRAGIFAAIMFAFSSYLTRYSQQTQPDTMMLVLGLVTTGGFIQAFVHRRRRYLWLFAGGLTLALYTQGSAGLFAFGALVAFALIWRMSEDRRGLLRDAAIGFGAPLILFVPWLPTTIWQIAHTTSPWHYTPLLGADVPSDLIGGERVDVTLLVAVLVGIAPLVAPDRRRRPDALALWTLAVLVIAAMGLARFSTIAGPGWVSRYFGVLVPALLLLGALGAARARVVGVAAIVLCIGFLANASSFASSHTSDMRDVAAEMNPYLHPGDLVVVGQPEQTPLVSYYLDGGLHFASTIGPVADPTYMNWSHAQAALQHADPSTTLGTLVASLKPGQQLLFVRPLTEGAQNWRSPWTMLVRRRAAQWGQLLTEDVAHGTLVEVTWAPHFYRSACCVADSAMLYRKAS